jgi:sulfate/thiosulfate transport system ATP-binding protein
MSRTLAADHSQPARSGTREEPAVVPAGLAVEGLTKRFVAGVAAAVNEVSFSVPAGTITTLLGPSGSGKSTMLRLIAGLEIPDAGRVVIGGVDGTRLPPQRRGVGFVFQSYALFPHMTVSKNIAFGLKVRKAPPAEIARQVEELLAAVELSGYGERFPSELSGGQRQRVAFARALAIHPKILLLDEPFGALDAQVRLSLRDWLRRFHEKRARSTDHPPVTTLLVTHDQEEAMELSHCIVVMNEGKVVQVGSPQDIYDRPASPFVASFVGGANVVPVAAEQSGSGFAYVRPHEVKLSKAQDQSGESDDEHKQDVALARVERLIFLGAYVKVSVRLPDGGALAVELPTSEVEALGIKEGDRVLADLQGTKLFLGDYSI